MNAKVADVIEAGLALEPDEREVAAVSLQSADRADRAQVDAAWRSEIGRRLDGVLNGRVELVDAATHSAGLRTQYAAKM